MLLWNTDYFELKVLEKQKMQEGLSALPCLPKSRSYTSQEKGALPAPGREHSYHQRLGVDAEGDLYKLLKLPQLGLPWWSRG